MATTVHADSRGMCSWWWDSHISPKNSKWLQENLSDMDEKIKQMIKLIEEDADSFAQRAEMYYMKRPDLLRLVEEFYRAYRALAERYDHATGFLRQAHHSVAEAFPDQVPSCLDDSILPAASSEQEDMFVDSREFNNHFLGQLLRRELIRIEAEKEGGLVQCQQCLLKISEMEKEIECAQAEAQNVKKELKRFEEEKEDVIGRYEMSLETISSLERKLADVDKSIQEATEQSDGLEIEVEILKQALEKMSEEKESASLECSKLSTKVVELGSVVEKMSEELTQKEEEIGRLFNYGQEEHQKSMEVETALQSLQNLLFPSQEKIGVLKSCNEDLQEQVTKAEEENKNLKELNLSSSSLIDNLRVETVSLRGIIRNLEKEVEIQVEEHIALHQEINLFKDKFEMLKEKYQLVMEQVQSVGLDPEGVRSYVKTMQDENSKLRGFSDQKSRENESLLEENALLEISVSELNSELEEVKQNAQDERSKLIEFYEQKLSENVTLLDKNALLANSLSGLNSELEEVKRKLQDEKFEMMKFNDENMRENADLLEKNALLKNSVSCLNSELEVVKHNLQDEKAKSREFYDENIRRMAALLEKNALLENSISHLNKALDEVQQKLQASEESRASLSCQLQVANKNLERLERKSDDTQKFLYDANAEIEQLRIMLKKSEDLWLLLLNEKLALITEKESLSYQLDLTKRRLEDLVLRCKDLDRKCFSFDRERAENAVHAELSRTRVAALENQVLLLQQEALSRNREFKDNLDKSLDNHFEMFILKNCMQDLEEKNSTLTFERWKFMKACESSERQRFIVEKSMSQKFQELQNFLWGIMDDNFQLLVEKSVLSIVIGEVHLEAKKIAMERDTIYKDLKVQSENYALSLNMLQEETGVAKLREQNLLCNLLKERHEVELWEAQAADFFRKMMISNFQEALLEEKVCEFTQSKSKESELLEKRIRFLEDENVRLMSMLEIHTSVEVPFKDWAEPMKNYASVEECLRADSTECKSNQERLRADGEEIQDIKLITHLQSVTSPIDEAAWHAQRRTEPENSSSSAKSDDKTKKIEDLRSKHHNSHQGNDPKTQPVSRRKEVTVCTNRHGKKPAQHPGHSKSEVLTKDIVLDQMSDRSTFRSNQKENFIGTDDRMLELWETTNISRSIDLRVGISRKAALPSRESFSEKELGVDNKEVSEKSSSEPCQGGKKLRLLERLNADAQKLTNLQITVQDLKRKVEVAERSRMGREAEYRTVKEKLEEAEMAVLDLFDVNHKLTKRVQGSFLSRSSGTETNDGNHVRGVKRKISEQARRGSEKIANLQLEVQKIQFCLLKLDDEIEKGSRGGLRTARVSERKTRVLLKDFLHVRVRANLKRKKGQFCACVQLPTRAK